MRQVGSTRPQCHAPDIRAAGQFLEFRQDGLPVLEKFVADDGVRDEDNQQSAFDDDRVRIRRVGGTNQLGPLFSDAMFERVMADPVFDQQLVHEGAEFGRLAAFGATPVRRELAEAGDEVLHRAAEFLGLVV